MPSAKNLPIKRAAELMGKREQFVRIGLQRGRLPFGTATKISAERYSYYISPIKFAEFTGLSLQEVIGENEYS